MKRPILLIALSLTSCSRGIHETLAQCRFDADRIYPIKNDDNWDAWHQNLADCMQAKGYRVADDCGAEQFDQCYRSKTLIERANLLLGR